MLLHCFVSATPREFPHSAISDRHFCNFWQAFPLLQFLAFPQLLLFPFRLWFSFVSFRAFKVHGMWRMQCPSFHFVLSRCMGFGLCNGFIVSRDRNILTTAALSALLCHMRQRFDCSDFVYIDVYGFL